LIAKTGGGISSPHQCQGAAPPSVLDFMVTLALIFNNLPQKPVDIGCTEYNLEKIITCIGLPSMVQKRMEPIEDNKKTITAIVQERIRDSILDGTLPGGSRLDQVQLAEDLNVSLVPIREALKKLEAEGFVQIVPRRGAFVSETSPKDMEDLYFTREILEGQAAYNAAEKLTEEAVEKLQSLFTQMGEALSQHDFDRFAEYNRDFHFTIYQSAESQYLLSMISNLWELSERYRFRYVFTQDRAASIQEEHQQILAACYARNKQELRDALIYHMQQTLIGLRDLTTTNYK
jgi:DNA-binding GntR family transcriptional regulator